MRDDHERSDEELVDAARNAVEGDVRAFEGLVVRHKERVVANCRYLTRSPADAEDLAQEVFLKAFFGLKRFEGRAAFRTWIQRIKVNHCLNHLRKNRDRVHLDVQDAALESEPDLQVEAEAERRVETADERALVREVLESLPDTVRIPLILRDLDELSYQEISETLGLGLSATKMRIKRGREEFRSRWEARMREISREDDTGRSAPS